MLVVVKRKGGEGEKGKGLIEGEKSVNSSRDEKALMLIQVIKNTNGHYVPRHCTNYCTAYY